MHQVYWNASSASRDYKHILIALCTRFDGWIQPLHDDKKQQCQALWPSFPHAHQAGDGSMYIRRKTKDLPPDTQRKDYDHQFNVPEAIDVNVSVAKGGICCGSLTDCPRRMSDENSQDFLRKMNGKGYNVRRWM